jgi:multidrug resistance protein MdtO
MAANFSSWLNSWVQKFWQDLQPTPGRLNSSLRIVLASIITLILLLVWQLPFASLGLYFIFIIGRDSPSVSVRSSIFFMVTLVAAVIAELAVVILTDNDPMARVISVAAVTFIAGVLISATTLPSLAAVWGFIFCILIALWERHVPPDTLVKGSLYLVATASVAVICSVAVEYIFADKHPAAQLQEQRVIRYKALEAMFNAYANSVEGVELAAVTNRVARLAAAGQAGMQKLYNAIVDRNLDTGKLPIGTRVRITMQAQLMDVSAAFGYSRQTVVDSQLRERCARIAAVCHELSIDHIPKPSALPERWSEQNLSLLDRVEQTVHSILGMPTDSGDDKDQTLVALPSKKVPILIPGALKDKTTIAFALKLSLCATICYIFYNAVDWPGISTAVTTVLITGLSTSGAIKQKFVFRFLGSAIGGLIFGIGSTAFLFPHMDSLTSLVILIAIVAFISAWWAAGAKYNYVGLQIAFSFYLVAFEGSSAPTELAPARDRLAGILVALVVMWFVFDQIWPVRTVTAMRWGLASVLRNGAKLFRLVQTAEPHSELLRDADTMRDHVGKTVASLRSMSESVEYEYGVNREQHTRSSEMILRAALTAVALFWNQLAVMHNEKDEDFQTQPGLIEMRRKLAENMDELADAVVQRKLISPTDAGVSVDPALAANPRYGEYAHNSIDRYEELRAIVSGLSVEV